MCFIPMFGTSPNKSEIFVSSAQLNAYRSFFVDILLWGDVHKLYTSRHSRVLRTVCQLTVKDQTGTTQPTWTVGLACNT
jgi:hypothetical protein